MNENAKSNLSGVGQVVGAIALAATGLVVVTNHYLSPVPPKPVSDYVHAWTWPYPADEIAWTIFEIQTRTNLFSPWRFYTNVVGTNVVFVQAALRESYFTISKCMSRANTNVATYNQLFYKGQR